MQKQMSDNEELTNYESFDEEQSEITQEEQMEQEIEFIQTKTIQGFSRYQIDRQGNIFDTKKNKQIKQTQEPTGYMRVKLCDENNKRFNKLVHRLLAEAFIPNPLGLAVVNHKNRVRNDNRLENIEWSTQSDNCRNRESDGIFFDDLPDEDNCCEFQFYNKHAFGHYFINTKTLEIYYDTNFQFKKLRVVLQNDYMIYCLRNTDFKQIKVSINKLKKGLYN
ncbi:HNH_endonuclease [Hexamita inflata]|uniref:HNH endonuclease n=1 Tax=Hexamita inflata TaxID=28002 RepID=A0AA86RFT1_9EUKA|nr:HNH endonuclease [Hexamita inflata]